MFTLDFKKDFNILLNRINSTDWFSFARFADGEYSVINKSYLQGIDGWINSPTYATLAEKVGECLYLDHKNFFFGISCPCCDYPTFTYYHSKLGNRFSNGRVTYSNIFVNANATKENLSKILNTIKDGIIVCNQDADINSIKSLFGGGYILIPRNALSYFNDYPTNNYVIDALSNITGKKVFFCAGPCSELLILELFKLNTQNHYIDLGSILDPLILGKQTRPYHSGACAKVCNFQL
jgi:hypothetical protein